MRKQNKLLFLLCIVILLSSCMTQKSLKSNDKFLNLMTEGDYYFYTYQFEKAITIYEKAKQLFPAHSSELNLKLASAYFENADYLNSIKYLEGQNKKDQEILFYLGNNYYYLKDFDKALKYYHKCRETPLILNNKAYMNYCKGNKEQAKEYYLRLLVDPESGLFQDIALVMLSHIENAREKMKDSSIILKDTLEKYIQRYEKMENTIYYDLYILIAICHYQLGATDTAYNYLEIAVKKGFRHFDFLQWDPLLSRYITNEEIYNLEKLVD
jgi:tetratricopeptide (TPR) repeat protein